MKIRVDNHRAELSRRAALELLAGGVAALAVGCTEAPGADVVAALDEPAETQPRDGVRRYATSLTLDGYATGVIVETRGGRARIVEGNPAHPASRGGVLAATQARILDLYDPQRSRGEVPPATLAAELARAIAPVWLVVPPQTSRTVAALIALAHKRHDLRVVSAAPLATDHAARGAELAFGAAVDQQLALDRADVIASLDADWAAAMPMSAAWARAASARRLPEARMNRLWTWQPMPTPTSALSDHAIAVAAGDVAAVAVAVVVRFAERAALDRFVPEDVVNRARARLGGVRAARAAAMADDLLDHRGAGAVVVGDRQPAAVHALARWIDAACGNAGGDGPITYTATARLPIATSSLAEFAAALRDDAVGTAVIVDCNPVYTAPELGLAELLPGTHAVHVGLWHDETAAACTTRIALAHELEAWADARAWDGTESIAQPVMRPRFAVASLIDVVAALAGHGDDARALVRMQHDDLDRTVWHHALAAGAIDGTASPARAVEPRGDRKAAIVDALRDLLAERGAGERPAEVLELAIAPSALHDGRFSGNAWLQELPHGTTKQVWGNAAMMSAGTAAELGVDDGDVVELAALSDTADRRVALPALVVAGHADRAITVELGYGRATPRLPIADAVGADAYPLAVAGPIVAARVRPTPSARRIVRTQHEMSRMGRDLAPVLARDAALPPPEPPPSMLADMPPVGWAMTIDTTRCTGCSACMIACQAENNVPVVGIDDCAVGRHMGWLRIDRYVDDGMPVVHQPMLCQHCEHAPCEYVCPVGATVHSPDGLNEMIYNRCVGTRFCSNNCPYKVRRFNWFAYERDDDASLQYNPSVTVRSRGVMEKCTYCVQRIRAADHVALVEDRDLRPDEVVTACQRACPTAAIVFGRLQDDDAPLDRSRRDPRSYVALADLGTRPRTRYLARVLNPREGS